MAGCKKKVLRGERDLLILTAGCMRDSFKIDKGMRDEIKGVNRWVGNFDSNQAG